MLLAAVGESQRTTTIAAISMKKAETGESLSEFFGLLNTVYFLFLYLFISCLSLGEGLHVTVRGKCTQAKNKLTY
jgi:hypothetical protein